MCFLRGTNWFFKLNQASPPSQRAVPLLIRLVAIVLAWSPGFAPGSVHVRFVMDAGADFSPNA
jgi:hypothetical protein